MVEPGDPRHAIAAHTTPSAQCVLHCHRQRVPDVKFSRYIGWWKDYGKLLLLLLLLLMLLLWLLLLLLLLMLLFFLFSLTFQGGG